MQSCISCALRPNIAVPAMSCNWFNAEWQVPLNHYPNNGSFGLTRPEQSSYISKNRLKQWHLRALVLRVKSSNPTTDFSSSSLSQWFVKF